MSIAKYVEKLHGGEKSKANLLSYDGGDLRRDEEATNSITIVWQISFQHIRAIRRSAANLLSLMSFFDRKGISERLLSGYYDGEESEVENAGSEGGHTVDTRSDN